MIRPLRFTAIFLTAAVIAYVGALAIGTYLPWPGAPIVAFFELSAVCLVMFAAFEKWAWRR